MAPRPSRFSLSVVFSLCWSIWKQWSENSLSGSLCTRLRTTAVPQLSFWTLSVMSEENGRLLTNKNLIALLTHRKAHFIKTRCEQKKYSSTQPWFVFPQNKYGRLKWIPFFINEHSVGGWNISGLTCYQQLVATTSHSYRAKSKQLLAVSG